MMVVASASSPGAADTLLQCRQAAVPCLLPLRASPPTRPPFHPPPLDVYSSTCDLPLRQYHHHRHYHHQLIPPASRIAPLLRPEYVALLPHALASPARWGSLPSHVSFQQQYTFVLHDTAPASHHRATMRSTRRAPCCGCPPPAAAEAGAQVAAPSSLAVAARPFPAHVLFFPSLVVRIQFQSKIGAFRCLPSAICASQVQPPPTEDASGTSRDSVSRVHYSC